MGTNEENIMENFVCFIYGGAGAGAKVRIPAPDQKYHLRLRNTVHSPEKNLLPLVAAAASEISNGPPALRDCNRLLEGKIIN